MRIKLSNPFNDRVKIKLSNSKNEGKIFKLLLLLMKNILLSESFGIRLEMGSFCYYIADKIILGVGFNHKYNL